MTAALWFLIVSDAAGVARVIGAALDEASCYAAMISATPHDLLPWVVEALCVPVASALAGA